MAIYRLLADHYIGQRYLEAGEIVDDTTIPGGWPPTLAVDPLDTDAIKRFWLVGPRAMGSILILIAPQNGRWQNAPIAPAKVQWIRANPWGWWILTGAGAVYGPRPAEGGTLPMAGTTVVNNLGTTSIQVIGTNPSRKRITFFNPGTVDVLVSMALDLSGQPFSPTFAARGGAALIFGNGGEKSFEGECQGAWNAVAASGSTNPLTIIDSNF